MSAHTLINLFFVGVGIVGLAVIVSSLFERTPAAGEMWLTTPPTEAGRSMRLQRGLHLIRQFEEGGCPFCGQERP